MKCLLYYLAFVLLIGLNYSRLSQSFPSSDDVVYASIYINDKNEWIIENQFNTERIAAVKYSVGLEKIGWDLLAVKTNKNYPDDLQAEAAGRLEGYLTRQRIWDHWRNLNQITWKGKNMTKSARKFFREQEEYILEMYKSNPNDAILANAYYLLRQLNGLRDSYNLYVSEEMKIDNIEFHTIASFGDLFDIKNYDPKNRPDLFNWSLEKLEIYTTRNNHCSALFKVKEDLSDIFFGHNSWFEYSAMTRIFKEYYFNFNNPAIKSRHILFSSYPANLGSNDDFYVTSQDLAVIETTNTLYDDELYNLLTPRSLLTWQRAMIANRLSSTSKEWVENFSKENSGTYNNMFMALDMKKVNLENGIIENEAMFIIEQIPGTTDINDVTEYLKYGYWPSFNAVFSRKISKLSKIDEMIVRNPSIRDLIDYYTAARAIIFRRDHSKANSKEGFQQLIRYNDYLNDPASKGIPTLSISARGDLNNYCGGAYDAKMSSVSKAKGKNKVISIISGPTTGNNLPQFKWSDSDRCSNDPKYGLPDQPNFDWFEYHNEFYDEFLYRNETQSLLKFLE
jgi:hypothetical protein